MRLRASGPGCLADCLDRYLKLLKRFEPDNKLDAESLKLLRKLHAEDEWGDAFRYAMIGRAPNTIGARPLAEARDFPVEVNQLHRLAILLAHSYSTVLSDYEEMQLSGLWYRAQPLVPEREGQRLAISTAEPGSSSRTASWPRYLPGAGTPVPTSWSGSVAGAAVLTLSRSRTLR
ncbi:hypothetical protein ACH4Y0_02195 [Streptomyces sp. NPDC020707]|uniref:hypothetical protein n=1 Tax=Streptomyces sp. NPDC020707 TaxID=3365084 RepID=UPI0037920E25